MDDMRLALILNADLAGDRRRARARGEGHREVDDGARAGRGAAAGRRRGRLPVLLRAGLPRPGVPGRPAPGRGRRPSARPARLVELPVGATEDRLTGSLDLERALTEGVTAFEPGLLAAAHRGVLYVDEVNLLHDHLVDLLLDAAALGTQLRGARRRVGAARGEVPAGRHDEPGGGRAAAAAARPVRPDRGGGRAARPGEQGRGRAPPAGLRRRPGGVRGAVRRRRGFAGRGHRRRPGAAAVGRACPTRPWSGSPTVCAGLRGGRAAGGPRDRPGRGRARRLARPGRRSAARTSASPPGWRCRTGGGATRSTRRASTRSSSMTRSATSERRRTGARPGRPEAAGGSGPPTTAAQDRARRLGRDAARVDDGAGPPARPAQAAAGRESVAAERCDVPRAAGLRCQARGRARRAGRSRAGDRRRPDASAPARRCRPRGRLTCT